VFFGHRTGGGHTLRGRGWRVIAACRKPQDVAARQADGFDSVRIDHGDAASVERRLA
jgi:uncharacterized protein YbjT (DUF2867 family)